MSDPQRRQVRVRRSPKLSVFLSIGAVLGALVAVVAVNVTPPDPTTPAVQAIGFLILLLAPVGALLGGSVGLVLDAVSERRAKTVDAELVPSAPASTPTTRDPRPDAPASEQEHVEQDAVEQESPDRA